MFTHLQKQENTIQPSLGLNCRELMTNNWLQELKQGDRVYFGNEYLELGTVDRVTKTLIIVGGKKYRKSDGYQTGDWTCGTPQLYQPTHQRDCGTVNSKSGNYWTMCSE